MKNLTPLVHNSLLDEMEVIPLNENDMPCIKEIRDVLKKHNRLDRFGINLLHKHFELDEDEILIESVHEETRTQIIKPFNTKDVEKMEGEVLETSWSLQDGKVLMGCSRKCVRTGEGHYSSHVNTF